MTGKLTAIELFGSSTAEVRIGLDSGYNSGGWAADVMGAQLGSLIDLSSYNIFVTSGQSFVIDVVNLDDILYGTWGKLGHGQLYFTNQTYTGYAYTGEWALGYVTYVDTDANAVPEPGSLALVALSALGLAAVRRRHPQ